jgi:hypothetical protein
VSLRENRYIASLPAATPVDDAKLYELASRLRSLHEGDVAVVEAIAIGAPAIPVLRMFCLSEIPREFSSRGGERSMRS